MGDLQHFHSIIAALLSTTNNEREAAEKQYNTVPSSRKTLFLHQLGIDTSVATEVRDMALVLLRRIVADKMDNIVDAIQSEFNQMKDQLIQSTSTEQISSIRKRLTDVISNIARQTIDDDGAQQWNTVVEFIGHCGVSDNGGLRECAMILVENVPNIFGVSQNQLLNDIKQMRLRMASLIMSRWQAYITKLLDSCEGIKSAAIVGTDGAVWARSEGENEFRATEAELRSFVSNFNNLTDVPAKGADLEGVHYIVPYTEENLIFGKKFNFGFFAVKTNTAVIIAIYEGNTVLKHLDSIKTSVCAEARTCVEKLATHLSRNGY